MHIGALAKTAGCQTGTVRYYENIGLLPPPNRSDGDYRLYGRWHVERLQFIRQCRALGMSIDEIRTLLKYRDNPSEICGEVNQLMDDCLEKVQRQIDSLHQLKRCLKKLQSKCKKPRQARDCGILSALSTDIS